MVEVNFRSSIYYLICTLNILAAVVLFFMCMSDSMSSQKTDLVGLVTPPLIASIKGHKGHEEARLG